MHIYFDYDGVFGDTMTPAIAQMKELGLYDTEEGRTKYFAELDWGSFLIRAGFIKNAPEAINALMKLGYKVSFLTQVNSLAEHEEKINFIKNIKEFDDPEHIDVIAVPRRIDKSVAVNPVGHVLLDDRLHNIETWEQAGGYGVLFSETKNDNYITISDPMDLVDIVLSIDKNRGLSQDNVKESLEVSSLNENMMEKLVTTLRKYKDLIELYLIYNKLVKERIIEDDHYNIENEERLVNGIKFYYDIINGNKIFSQNVTYEFFYDLLYLVTNIENEVTKQKYKNIKMSIEYYNNALKMLNDIPQNEEEIFSYNVSEYDSYHDIVKCMKKKQINY